MVSKKYQTEWIAAHLLFPNSAQARDIFSFVISETEKTADTKLFFKHLVNIYLKTQLIQSGHPFVVFDQNCLRLWPEYFKKLNKEDVLLLIGYAFFDLSISHIAQAMGLSVDITNRKIKNSIFKLLPKPELPLKKKHQFIYKKYNELMSSDFFIYDEMIEYTFDRGLTNKTEVSIKIRNEISKKTYLQDYLDHLRAFKNELEGLKELFIELPPASVPNKQSALSEEVLPRRQYYIYAPLVIFVVSAIGLLIYRPEFLKNYLVDQKVEIVELQQINIDRYEDKKDKINEPISEKPVFAEIKSADQTVKVAQVTAKVDPDRAAAVKLSTDLTAAPSVVVTTPKSTVSAADIVPAVAVRPKANGGLYRGRLKVTDVQQVLVVVKEKIISLGGKKAGEVELGWMKNDNTSYFHFSFPEQNQADLKEYLKQFGTVELVYEPHPRIMPKGLNRYIFEIIQNE